METATVADAYPAGSAEIEAALTRVIEQIDEVREQMKTDDAVIAQLKADNAALKAEAQALRDETRAILTNLQSIS